MSRLNLLTVGTYPMLVRQLWDKIALAGGQEFSHLVHPSFSAQSWNEGTRPGDQIIYFSDGIRMPSEKIDVDLLASLEMHGAPTIHNMILGDSVVAKLPYADALAYATFLAHRLEEVYRSMKPAAIIGDFDGLHGSMGYAVAKRLGIPWFALRFSALPNGHVAFCSDLSPGSVVTLEPGRHEQLRGFAAQLLVDFEMRRVNARYYIPPDLLSPSYILRHIPAQITAFAQTFLRRRQRQFLRYTEAPGSHSVWSRVRAGVRVRRNLVLLRRQALLRAPPAGGFALFGLHMQPEASVDVWAPFFSNQIRVVELMSRSLPPTHKLLVKLHQSDVTNYAPEYLAELAKFPGVELVSPYAITREFVERADLVFSIQGTMGQEAALLGKPVIMFGNILAGLFPTASMAGKTTDLPALVRAKLAASPPSRSDVIDALARFLVPFYPASDNDWRRTPDDAGINGFVSLFNLLDDHLHQSALLQTAN